LTLAVSLSIVSSFWVRDRLAMQTLNYDMTTGATLEWLSWQAVLLAASDTRLPGMAHSFGTG
jgi:hypothetical protein